MDRVLGRENEMWGRVQVWSLAFLAFSSHHNTSLTSLAPHPRQIQYLSTMSNLPPEQQPLLDSAPSDTQPSNNGDAGVGNRDPEHAAGGGGTFTRNLGTLEAFAIVISIVIGSGVFTSPGSIDTNVPSPGAALVVWLVGGILAWTGASTLAELGTAIPGEGTYKYLTK